MTQGPWGPQGPPSDPRRRLRVVLGALIALLVLGTIALAWRYPAVLDDRFRLAHLAYLGALAALIGFGFVGEWWRRPGRALGHAAIWLGIGLLLTVAYTLRVEIAEFAGRVAGEVAPSMALVSEDGAVILRRAADGHFHADVAINGRTVRVLVDTGASTVSLSPGDARRAGLDPDALAYTVPVTTANGRVMVAPVTLARIRLGAIEARDVRAHVNPGIESGSLLGMSFLDRLSRVSIEGDRLVLED